MLKTETNVIANIAQGQEIRVGANKRKTESLGGKAGKEEMLWD